MTKRRFFKRVLIANRGEIALRVIRALKSLGIESVAVYSDADSGALHAREADLAYRLPGLSGVDTYLNIARIVEIAKASDVDAIHPGYGFLSENAEFARRCEESSLKFIGPSSKTLETSGNKFACKVLAKKNGVPVTPASDEPVGDADQAAKLGSELGFPVLLKSAFGGGGRGIKEARSKQEVRDAFESSQREARGAFGRFSAFVEKKLVDPRHIEIQILASDDGQDVIHLGERECSVQRRYQKLVEISPSPVMDGGTRKTVAEYAIKVAWAVNYSNACTIEFLRDSETGNYYFLEVNSRLQVEHPVTELVTGVDIVASQILIASGENLPLKQSDVHPRGTAIECRVNAEDPSLDFAPSTGRIEFLRLPGGPGVRVDCALEEGLEVTPYYDSLLAKLLSYGEDFTQARKRMSVALGEFKVAGLETTIPFHEAVMRNGQFASGEINTGFIEHSNVMREMTEARERIISKDEYCLGAFLLSRNQFASEEMGETGRRRNSSIRRATAWPNTGGGGRFVEPL